jgi:hypothetical protein
MVKVVFIACLPHSGSTLLSLILGKHPLLTGVGEVRNVLGAYVDQIREKGVLCSCGGTIDDCRFWGRVAQQLDTRGGQTIEQQYQIVLDTFQSSFGREQYFVDASKKIEVLDLLRKNPNVDLRVIHLVRDVRSFTVSAMDKTRMRRERKLDRSSRLRVPSFFFWHWHRGNQAIQRFAKQHGIPTLQIGYEELCLQTRPVLEEVCAFLGITPHGEIFSNLLSGSSSHIIRGNHMRFDAARKAITYDNRWMNRKDWLLPAFLFQAFMKFNAQMMRGRPLVQAGEVMQARTGRKPDGAGDRKEAARMAVGEKR